MSGQCGANVTPPRAHDGTAEFYAAMRVLKARLRSVASKASAPARDAPRSNARLRLIRGGAAEAVASKAG